MRKITPLILLCLGILVLNSCKKDKPFQEDDITPEICSEPIITLNPNGNTPLTASIEICFKQSGQYTITVEGDEPYIIVGQYNQGKNTIPVKGLYAGRKNSVNLQMRIGSTHADTTLIIETEPLPDFFPDISVKTSGIGFDKRWTLCEFSAANNGKYNSFPLVVDNKGEVRWYADYAGKDDLIYPIRFNNSRQLMIPIRNKVHLFDFLGENFNTISLGSYLQHHEIFQRKNGNYIVAVDAPSLSRVEDLIIEVNEGGGVIQTWDMKDILDVNRNDILIDHNDWFHMNAVYEDKDGSLLISGRNQGVVKVNRGNELQWILAPHRGWGKAGENGDGHETSDFLLTAIDANGNPYNEAVQLGEERASDFDWPWGQHAVMRLKNGNILLFDNGFRRQFNTGEKYSRAVEYKIDETNKTVQQVWEYGETRAERLFSSIISDVDELPSGNILVTPGFIENIRPENAGKVIEVGYPGKNVLFELTLEYKNLNGNGNGWGQSDIMYRAEKINF